MYTGPDRGRSRATTQVPIRAPGPFGDGGQVAWGVRLAIVMTAQMSIPASTSLAHEKGLPPPAPFPDGAASKKCGESPEYRS